ncbi:MAG: hypothetical protein ABIR33_16705 [Pyrinomonadaceae bacterium]
MRVAVLALLTAFACIAVSGQYNVVTEAEFKTACGMTVPVPLSIQAPAYRMTIETKSAMEGRPSSDYASRNVTSYQNRTTWHRLLESAFGSTKRISEDIFFGGKMYSRTGDGEWIEQDLSNAPNAPVPAKSETRYLSIEYRLLPDESIRGTQVRVCEKFEVAAVKIERSNYETRRESTSKYWVTDEGLLKSENSYRNAGEKGTTTSWIKNEWEVDPTIKVTPPQKFAQQP